MDGAAFLTWVLLLTMSSFSVGWFFWEINHKGK